MFSLLFVLPLAATPVEAGSWFDPLPPGARLRIGSPRLRHGGTVTGLVFTPDGKGIVSVGGGDLIHWDAATGKEIRRFSGAGHLALTRDGRVLATAPQSYGKVILWDLATGKKLHELPDEWNGHVLALAFSPDGNLLSRAGYEGVRLRYLETGKERQLQADKKEYCHSLHFAPDGRTLLGGRYRTSDGGMQQLILWNVADGKELRRFQPSKVHPADYCTRADFSADGKLVAAGTDNGTGSAKEVFVWDAATGKELRRFRHPTSVFVVALAPDGRTLAVAGRGGVIILWNLETGQEAGRLEVSPGPIGDTKNGIGKLAFSPDGKRLASSGYYDFTIRVWDLATRKLVHPFNVPDRGLTSALLSADGKRVVTGGSDGTVRIWNSAAGKPVLAVKCSEGEPSHLALTADGSQLLAGDRRALSRWEVAGGKRLPCWERDKANWWSGPEWVAVAPDGREALMGFWNKKEVRLVDLATGKTRWRLPATGLSGSALFSADGKTVYVQSNYWMGRVNRASGKMEREVQTNHAPWGLRAVSADGKWLVDSYSQIIDTADLKGQRFLVEERHIGPAASRPDGKILALAVGPGHIQLWDTASWKALRDLKGHRGAILSLMYSADGRTLLSAGADGTVLLWDARR
ncbi:MAG: WD40 repeat domain-containing protein [Gemmataceae bacterium]|nr:WD40 repeat domain-containing protein [Gemmataceae bacterium]